MGKTLLTPAIPPQKTNKRTHTHQVNKVTSTQTQIPYDYYSFPFCHPPNGVHHYGENLGEFLTGDRIENSPYEIQMKVDQSCTVLCARAINECVDGG